MSRAPRVGQDLRKLRLADAGLAFEQQRATELERQEDGGRQGPVRDVVPTAEVLGQGIDRAGAGRAVVARLVPIR